LGVIKIDKMEFIDYTKGVIGLFDEKWCFDLQNHWKVRFPKNYLELVKINQGKVVTPNVFKYKVGSATGESCLSVLFHFTKHPFKSVMSYSVAENTRKIVDIMGEKVIPFSEDPGGFSIAFDFRKTAHNPPVIIIDMEAENFKDMILPVAEDFETFWKGLY